MDHEQLRTLVAVIDEGSFEAGAMALAITPSAVSQRVKALESGVGHLLVRRETPPVPTAAGEVLLRLAREQELLHREARAALGQSAIGPTVLTLAVNADSLATWFGEVIEELATWDGVTVRLRVDDQDHTRELLRSGAVLGAVTAEVQPVSGCRAVPLGSMRYLPCAAPELVDRFRRGRRLDWDRLPVLRFNARDDLQAAFLGRLGHVGGVMHEIPGSGPFVCAILAGLGWGLIPQEQLADHLTTGRLVRLGREHVDIPLHWQAWSARSDLLSRLADTITATARRHLRSPHP